MSKTEDVLEVDEALNCLERIVCSTAYTPVSPTIQTIERVLLKARKLEKELSKIKKENNK